jgi:hypothetical protein
MNRFDENTNQQYVSTYVPQKYVGMPLEALTNLAKNYSDKYKQGVSDIDKAQDEFLKINAVDKHQGYKKQLIESYKPRVEKLAEEFIKNPTDYNTKLKLDNLVREFKYDPTRQELENSYSNYQEYQKDKIKKGDKYGEWYDNYLGFKGEGKEGPNAYRYTGMGEIQNHSEEARKQMDKVGSFANEYDTFKLDQSGNIIGVKGGKEEIASNRIRQLAQDKSQSFLATKEGQDFAKMVSYYNPKMNEEQLLKASEDYLYNAGQNQIMSKVKSGKDFKYAPKDVRKPETEDNMPGLGQAQPGSAVYNLTDELPESIKSAITTKDGKVNIDFTKLGGGIKIEGASGSPYTMGTAGNMSASKSSNEKNHKDLAKFIIDAAKSIGYKDQIKSDNYNDILTKYMEGAKSVSFDYKMIPNEQQVVKNDIIEYPDHYSYTDDKGKPIVDRPTDEKNPLTKDNLKVGRRVYKNGQAMIEVEYMEGDTPKKMYAQPLAVEDKNYHNGVAKIQEDGLNFYKTGKPADTKEVKDLNEKYGFNKPGYSGLKPISAVILPNGKLALTLGDKNNRLEQKYELFNPKTGEREEFSNMAQMMEVLNKEWFSTNQGKGQASSIAPKKTNYENLTEE